MTQLCCELFRRGESLTLDLHGHRNAWKLQLATAQIAHITRDEVVSLSRDRQFHKVIVRLIAKIGPPSAVNSCPLADRQKYIQESFTLGGS
jgi:hypothetical protein